jgi:hypothetical protein
MASDPDNLVIQFSRTELWKASFWIRVAEPWNAITIEQKHAQDSEVFRKLGKHETSGGQSYSYSITIAGH